MPAAARLGDKAQVDADAHGCPACPHPAVGPIVTGSPDVFVNGKPAARQDDLGIHAACCGPNTFTIQKGSPTVYVNGKPFARMNDQTKHCGASGPIIEGSPDVNIDDGASAQRLGSYLMNALQILLQSTTAAKPPKQKKKSDTHTSSAGQQQNLAATPVQGQVKSARWSVQRGRDLGARRRRRPGSEGAIAAGKRRGEREAQVEGRHPASCGGPQRSRV